ncbi:FecR domain-containing protein [Verrucomicrobiaceae bacterium N1E253]|uniref:FecR domain-containing protein n=1 Tax=Oceaniferula marina TaxID=2748318 RepID=A0A851GQE5_9BACT|nr:LamG-like jellyroll fold domain-containing protein [Oceaniferula marina]NWK57335.1 FecR domain-containing protein [Oceaniferula marina]
MTDEHFYHALSRLADNDIDPELFGELEAYLLSSDQARAQYQEFMQLQSLVGLELDVHHRSEPHLPVQRILFRQKRRAVFVAWLSAAAVLILGAVLMRLYLMPEPVAGDLVFKSSPGTEISVTHSGEGSPTGQTMQPGSRMVVEQGVVELQFASGVRSVVMAPADLTMRSEGELFLREGRAWFHVPEQAIGFKVRTDDLSVLDLGTEFGVLARPGEHDEVHVFKGRVEVESLRVRKQKGELTAGQARRIDPVGRLVEISTNSGGFLAELPDSLPYLHWSFDDGVTSPVAGTYPYIERINTVGEGGTKLVDGPFGKALSLNGQGQKVATDWPGFEGTRARTVAFWIRFPEGKQPQQFGGIVGWGDNSHEGGKWSLIAHQDKESRGRISLFWGNRSVKTSSVIGAGQWTHVVVRDMLSAGEDGGVSIYVNGQSEPLKGRFYVTGEEAETLTVTKNAMPLTFGETIRDPEIAHRRRQLKADLDEIYVFDGALTDEQIRQFTDSQRSQFEKFGGNSETKPTIK